LKKPVEEAVTVRADYAIFWLFRIELFRDSRACSSCPILSQGMKRPAYSAFIYFGNHHILATTLR